MYPGVGLLFGFALQTLFRASVSLFLAQTVNRPATRQRYHPPERFSFLRGEISRLVPDLHKNFLQKVIGFSLVMNHAQDQRFQNPIVSIVRLGMCIWLLILDRVH